MSEEGRKMRLGAFFIATGHHVTSWRHPDSQADGGTNINHYIDMARTAERGKFDMIFLADSLAVRQGHPEAIRRSAQHISSFEPLTLIAALATVTDRIGLVASASTTFHEPYNLARMFASIDHISHGRAGWNIVTSGMGYEAPNFGREKSMEHDNRYARAREFTQVATGLWDSWEDDAFLYDKEEGLFFDPEKLHQLNHKGEFFSVRGPLNIGRPPQGYPVLVQAGASETGRAFASEFAETIFTAHLTMVEAKEFYDDVKGQAAARGRNPDHIKVLPGLSVLVGRTEEEAEEKHAVLQSMVHPQVALEILSFTLGNADLSGYPLDGPVPDLPEVTQGSRTAFRTTMNLARSENLTIRELAMRMATARNRIFIKGTAEKIVTLWHPTNPARSTTSWTSSSLSYSAAACFEPNMRGAPCEKISGFRGLAALTAEPGSKVNRRPASRRRRGDA
jgi:FMN-dependent oxidoreductase (nitrilotriacetate monooxygenase family)